MTRWRKLCTARPLDGASVSGDKKACAEGAATNFAPISAKVKMALRKGLPISLRAAAWFHYSGAEAMQRADPMQYSVLLEMAAKSCTHTPMYSYIEGEVANAFASNVFFRRIVPIVPSTCTGSKPLGGAGAATATSPTGVPLARIEDEHVSLTSLRRILLAIAFAFPAIGCSTGISLGAATALLVTRREEHAFWIMVCVIRHRLPMAWYDDQNLGCNVELDVLCDLIEWKLPDVHERLKGIGMPLQIIISSWFTHLFIDQLPFETALRIWDSFLSEGSKVLIRCALALFQINREAILETSDPFALVSLIRNMPKGQYDAVHLLRTAFDSVGSLPSSWLEKRRALATPGWIDKHAVRRFSQASPDYCPSRADRTRDGRHAPLPAASSPQCSLQAHHAQGAPHDAHCALSAAFTESMRISEGA